MEATRGEQSAAPAQHGTGDRHAEQHQPDADHDAEGEEGNRHVGTVGRRRRFQALDIAVPGMREVEAAEMWNVDGVEVAFLRHVRPAEQGGGDAVSAVPQALDGSEFGGLVLPRVEALRVAEHELQRGEHQDGPHGEGKAFARDFGILAQHQMQGGDAGDEKASARVPWARLMLCYARSSS
jgi:hypothetical protein